MTREQRVAVIGLGAMGLPIARNLRAAGVDVVAYDGFPAAAERARAAGLTVVDSADAVDAGIVLTVLPDMPQVRDALDAGLRSTLRDGDVLVVMGTVSPRAMVELHDELAVNGITAVDAAMSGGDVGAQNANMALMFGGSEEVLQRLTPVFNRIAGTIRHLGEVGTGHIAKACNQVVVAVTQTALADAVTLARRSGLDVAALLDILQGGLAASQVLAVDRQRIETEDYTPGGRAEFLLKDLNFALDVAAQSGTELAVTPQVAALYKDLIAHGDGHLDKSAIVREVQRRNAH